MSMRIALGSDEQNEVVDAIERALVAAGHEVTRFGRAAGQEEPWGKTGLGLGTSVAQGRHQRGVVCCFTGTGVSIAANKVPGVRAALCVDAETARGARRWNDANVLALSLRLTTAELAREIVGAWLSEPYLGEESESLALVAEFATREPR